MSEFLNDEKRETYVNGLLAEKADNQQHLAAAQAAGRETSEILDHLRQIDVELKRIGVDVDGDDVRAKVAEKRPSQPAKETR